jgi:hypothetical protein
MHRLSLKLPLLFLSLSCRFQQSHNCSYVSRMKKLSLTLHQLFLSWPCRFQQSHNCSCVSRMHRLSLTLPQVFLSLPCRFQQSQQLFLCVKNAGFNRAHNCFCVLGCQSHCLCTGLEHVFKKAQRPQLFPYFFGPDF